MKTRNLLFGLAVVVALAIAIPAFGATHRGHHPRPSRAVGGVQARRGHHDRAARRPATAAVATTMPFSATPLTTADAAQLARDGSITLPITFTGPGTVDAVGESPVGTATTVAIGTGPEGHSEKMLVPRDYRPSIQPASVTATTAGTGGLVLTLTDWAKSELAAGNDLEVLLSLEPSQGASESVPGEGMFIALPGS